MSVNIHRGPGYDPELTSGPSRGDKHDKLLRNGSPWACERLSIRSLLCKAEVLSLIPGTHIKEESKLLLQVTLWL